MTKTHVLAFAFAVSLSPLAAPAEVIRSPRPLPQVSADRLKGTYTFRMTPAVSFAPWYDGTNGRDSGVTTAPRQDILRVGTFTANGRGAISGHTIATTDDGATTVVIDFTWS